MLPVTYTGNNTQNYWVLDFVHHMIFQELENKRFWIDASSFSGAQEGRFLLRHLRMETDQISKRLCSLVFRIPDDGQSPKTQ
jgi:hypothetical protein